MWVYPKLLARRKPEHDQAMKPPFIQVPTRSGNSIVIIGTAHICSVRKDHTIRGNTTEYYTQIEHIGDAGYHTRKTYTNLTVDEVAKLIDAQYD